MGRYACLSLLLFALACASGRSAAPARVEPVAAPSADAHERALTSNPRAMTVVLSSETSTKYCNGEQMDSAGYKKTLTREKPLELPPEGASTSELVRAVVNAATEGMCQTVMSQLEYRNEGGTLHIPPFDAWAGVSITMCACQPEVELNFVRIPGVSRVVWDEE